MIEIVPATDIIGGKCVRLTRGDYSSCKSYDCLPEEMALRLFDCGIRRLHVVDLDGAKASEPLNIRSLVAIKSACPDMVIEWGGGVKSQEALEAVLSGGADCAIIGSVAVRQPSLMEKWLDSCGGGRIVLGADARDGRIATNAWMESSDATVESLVEHFLPYGLTQMVCTDISRDGMLGGVDAGWYKSLQDRYPSVDITVSGGISSMEDIEELSSLGLRRVIIGKALYEGRITLRQMEQWLQRG